MSAGGLENFGLESISATQNTAIVVQSKFAIKVEKQHQGSTGGGALEIFEQLRRSRINFSNTKYCD